SQQLATLRAQLAEQSSTLLDNHPRIKELKAQIAALDRQIRDEAQQTARSLENDASIAGGRVNQLQSSLDQLKQQAASSNGDDVQLRALDRDAKALRDLLESYLAKYREANARDSLGTMPTETRIISRALVSNTPYFPKKLPIVLIATLATLFIAAGFITTGELLGGNVYRNEIEPLERNEPMMAAAAVAPAVAERVAEAAFEPAAPPAFEPGPPPAPSSRRSWIPSFSRRPKDAPVPSVEAEPPVAPPLEAAPSGTTIADM